MREKFMRRALELAAPVEGRTRPNPLVGAVVARGEEVVGQGYHSRPGAPHAEALALDQAGPAARGGDLYVNLEPCSHRGRTPPCTERIRAAGISRVLVSVGDPNPLVNGQGFVALREAGLPAEEGPCVGWEEEGANDPCGGLRLCDLSVETVREDIVVAGYLRGETRG